uniref:L10-interacting MYB domain-containing protein-like n=1 Tax=Erigeron canadensis TaxID=72917 RepID=UPI001CB8E09B|nr:L10-interacting MYB domain-containing protein-like [Erigeron canadensis]
MDHTGESLEQPIDQIGDSLKLKKGRASWKQEGLEKTFLEACVHESSQNGQNSMTMQAWKNVGETLKKEHGFIVDQRQMKNRYDYIKGKFNVWLKLKNRTGNLYNPVTKSFNLTEEEWAIEMKSNKYAEPLKNAPLMYPDLCIKLYDASAAIGCDGWGPASGLRHPEESHEDPELNEDVDSHHLQQEPLDTTLEPPPLNQACSSRS